VRVRKTGAVGTLSEWSHTAGGHTRARVRIGDEPSGCSPWFHAHELEPVEAEVPGVRMDVIE
jgi:hypothetical protein